MLTIISIIWGNKYSNDYVNKLYRGIRRNTSLPFEFVCYVDDLARLLDPEIIKKPIPFFTGDWYSKIGLYNKDLYRAENQIFYFDLDTVIVNNLDDILSYSGYFAIVRDFYRPKGLQSCFMSWKPKAVHHMWSNYKKGWHHRYGDQAWCELQYPSADIWQELYPGKIVSYKVDIKPTGRLLNSSIVCFHGKPNPHEIAEQEWMKEVWK